MIKKYILLLNFIIPIPILIFYSGILVAADVVTPPTFATSDLQKNGAIITSLEDNISKYTLSVETEDLNYALHLIGFNNTMIPDSKVQFITDYSRMYCNPPYESSLPECGSGNPEHIYATIRPSRIFDSLSYSVSDLNIAKAVVRTITDPFPNSKINDILSDPSKLSDQSTQSELAELIASKAHIMIAKNTFNEIIARRYLDPKTSDTKKNNKTIMQIMQQESSRRLTDPAWINNLLGFTNNQLIMELLEIEAFKLWMDYNKFSQNERIEALLATLISAQVVQGSTIKDTVNKVESMGIQK